MSEEQNSPAKHALLLCGSPNLHGSTAALLGEAARGLADAGIRTEIAHLGVLRIGPCLGCNACDEGPCAQNDDMAALLHKLAQADVVAVGSPSYWGDVTAQMKAFIDRCLPLCDTRPGGCSFPKGKAGIAIAVRAGRNAAENHALLDTMQHFFGHLGIRCGARVHAEGISSPADLPKDALHRAYEAGLRALAPRATPPFTLRAATVEDATVLARLNNRLILDEGSDNPMNLEQLTQRMLGFLREEYRAVIIEVNAQVAGYCLYRPQTGGVYVRQYMMKPQHRALGLGKAAFLAIKSEYLEEYGGVTLDVLHCNPVGMAFWKSVGFVPYIHQMRL